MVPHVTWKFWKKAKKTDEKRKAQKISLQLVSIWFEKNCRFGFVFPHFQQQQCVGHLEKRGHWQWLWGVCCFGEGQKNDFLMAKLNR